MKDSKTLFVKLCAVGFLAITLSSCLKDRYQNYTPPPSALVMFVQASPDELPIDLSLDNNRVNNWPINYGDGIDYFAAFTGKRTANFYNHFTMNKLFSDTIHLNQNVSYSLFLANTAAKPEIVLLTDSLSKPAAGNARFRFINLSPDAPAVDLAVTGGSVLVANKAYKGHSSFADIAGNKNYNLEVRQAGTNTVLATLPNANIASGYVYTIWFRGLATTTNTVDQLGISIIPNAVYY